VRASESTGLSRFNSEGRRNGVILSAPGLSQRHESNSAFRVMQLKHGKPIDFVDYYADIMEDARHVLKWRPAYVFNELYGTTSLSQDELVGLVARLTTNSSLMWKYRRMMYLGHFFWRAFHTCLLTAVSRLELEQCVSEAPDATQSVFHSGRAHPSM
jgi:hypothetical protein